MPIATGAIIGGAALGAASGLLDTGINAWSADRLQNKSFEENQRSRDFEKYMASNKYQLMMSDLQKSGLNPSLALGGATGGPGGAVGPSGTAQSMSSSSIGASINKAVNSYLSYTLNDEKNALAFAKELREATNEMRSNSAKNYLGNLGHDEFYDWSSDPRLNNGGLTEI